MMEDKYTFKRDVFIETLKKDKLPYLGAGYWCESDKDGNIDYGGHHYFGHTDYIKGWKDKLKDPRYESVALSLFDSVLSAFVDAEKIPAHVKYITFQPLRPAAECDTGR